MAPGIVRERIVVTSMVDAVVDRLRTMVMAGVLAPGDSLPSERVLSEELGASRNVVREALGVLRVEGLVEVQRGKGSVIGSPSARQAERSLELLVGLGEMTLVELAELRSAIEPRIARLAAERAASDDKARLGRVMELLGERVHDPVRHVEADVVFHRELARMSGHRGYEWVVGAVRVPMMNSMLAGTQLGPDMAERSDEFHRRIVAAIVVGDGGSAERAMEGHMDYVVEYLRNSGVRGVRRGQKRASGRVVDGKSR